jgi:adenosine deaminase
MKDLVYQHFPKIELHVHLEGCVDARVQRLLVGSGADDTHYKIHSFSDFIRSYKSLLDLLKGPTQYRVVAEAMAQSLVAQNVLYVEVFLSAGQIIATGGNLVDIVDSVVDVLKDTEERFGLQWGIVLDITRHHNVKNAWKVLETALTLRDRKVVALGLGGDERIGPADQFQRIFSEAHTAGLKATVHAGEVGGPDSIWDALYRLGASRIGHGVRAIEDPSVIRELVRKKVAVETCPTSNIITGAVKTLNEHPARTLYEAGVPIVIGSDDPGLFGTTISDEYALVAELCGIGTMEMSRILFNSVDAAFLPAQDKQRLRDRVDETLSVFKRTNPVI